MTREEYLRTLPSYIKPLNEEDNSTSIDREAYLKSLPSYIKPLDAEPSKSAATIPSIDDQLADQDAAFGRGFMQGFSMGTEDELRAMRADSSVGYDKAHSQFNDELAGLHQRHRGTYILGNLGGAIALLALTRLRALPGVARHFLRLLAGEPKSGAGELKKIALGGLSGGLQGAATGYDTETRIKGAWEGALMGAGGTAILGGIGHALPYIKTMITDRNTTNLPTSSFIEYGKRLDQRGVSPDPSGIESALAQDAGIDSRLIGIESGLDKTLQQTAEKNYSVNQLFKTAKKEVQARELDDVTTSMTTHLPTSNIVDGASDVLDEVVTKTPSTYMNALESTYKAPAVDIFEQLKHIPVEGDVEKRAIGEILKLDEEAKRHFFALYTDNKNAAKSLLLNRNVDPIDRMRANFLDDGIQQADIEALKTSWDMIPSHMHFDFHLLHTFQNKLYEMAEAAKAAKQGDRFATLMTMRDKINELINTSSRYYLRASGTPGSKVFLEEYKDAVKSFRQYKLSEDALQSGRRAVNDTFENVADKMKSLTDPLEQQAFKVGMRSEMIDRASGTASSAKEMRKMLQEQGMEKKMQLVFGEDATKMLNQDIKRHVRKVESIPDVPWSKPISASPFPFQKTLSVFGHLYEGITKKWRNPEQMEEGLAILSMLKPGDLDTASALKLLQAYIKAAEWGRVNKDQVNMVMSHLARIISNVGVQADIYSGMTPGQAQEWFEKQVQNR